MKFNKSIAAVAVSALAVSAWAQDESADGDAAENGAPVAVKVAPKVKFYTLPMVLLSEGLAQVRKPAGEWVDVEVGRHYPLGSEFKTGKDGSLVLAFSEEAKVSLAKNSSFQTRLQTLDQADRAISLVDGEVDVELPEGLPEGAFLVTAPGFLVKNPAGHSRFTYLHVGDGDDAKVRCVTGSFSVEGRHFSIPVMRAANEVRIRTSSDFLVTQLDGTSGDYAVMLDRGVATKYSISDDGVRSAKAEPTMSEWRLSPKTKVRITRMLPEIGQRMSVHTMCFDAAGAIRSECCFCEGRAEVNSGELVPKDKSETEEMAKQAAEASETTEVEDTESKEAESSDESSAEE